LRNRDRYDLNETKRDEFEVLKKQEIISFFQFVDLKGFQDFYHEFVFLADAEESQNANLNMGLDMILENHLERNKDLTFSFLEHIMITGNPSAYMPVAFLGSFVKTKAALARRFWQIVNQNTFKGKTAWLMLFYEWLPEEFVNEEYYESMMAFYYNVDEPALWLYEHLEHYISFNPKVFRDFLALTVTKNEPDFHARLLWDFFQKNINYFQPEDALLIRKGYYQQTAIDQHFDDDFKDWLAILKFDPNFLIDYIRKQNWSNPTLQADDHRNLGILWTLDDAETIVETAILAIDWQGEPWVIPHAYAANELFLGIPAEHIERAAHFWQGLTLLHGSSA
jgi:hypothetical protein